MPSSVSFSRVFKAFSEARAGGQPAARLCVIGSGPARAQVVDLLAAGADEARGGTRGVLDARRLDELPAPLKSSDPWDVLVFVPSGARAEEFVRVVNDARKAGMELVVCLDDTHDAAWAHAAGFDPDEFARCPGQGRSGRQRLEKRIIKAAGSGAGSLALQLPALRRAYCDQVILTNAKQNGVIGVVVIIPGADMPAMTANQIRMVLQIAAAYGEEIGFDRAIEILSVVGSGFAFRALARQALAFVPGLGWAVKGAVGFSGTVALGRATVAYFEAGAPLQVSRMKRVNDRVERVRSRLPESVQRRMGAR